MRYKLNCYITVVTALPHATSRMSLRGTGSLHAGIFTAYVLGVWNGDSIADKVKLDRHLAATVFSC